MTAIFFGNGYSAEYIRFVRTCEARNIPHIVYDLKANKDKFDDYGISIVPSIIALTEEGVKRMDFGEMLSWLNYIDNSEYDYGHNVKHKSDD